ncbi:hypothetical protein JCM11491_004574 [Sporobolomyces phaffii]
MSPTPQLCASPLATPAPSTRRSSPTLRTTRPSDSISDMFSPSLDRTPTPESIATSVTIGGVSVAGSESNPAPAPSSRHRSPSPLAWNESGWLAGKFTFSPFDETEKDREDGESGRSNKREETSRSSSTSDKSASGSTSSTTSTSQEGQASIKGGDHTTQSEKAEEEEDTEEEEPRRKRIGSSKLAPTAPPFVFSPRPERHSSSASPPPFARLSPISAASAPRHASLPFPSTQPAIALDTPPHSALPRIDAAGFLIDQDSSYDIADEILKLQTTSEHGGPEGFPAVDDGRDEDWITEQQLHYNAMFSSPFQASPPRSRSSSIASTSSFFGSSQPRRSVDRNATVQQLASYFGPSPVDVALPILPAGFDNFPPPLSRNGSISSFDSGIYPPLAHPEPFNLTPEDDLYVQAREIYSNACCSTLKTTPPPSKLREIGDYFDKAMNQENPLAALYGVNSEQTKGFYANPATSGLDETVVKVAAMRGRQNQMLSVQRSAAGQILPGPSPNNRKLELYKTELCRSWEEKGSCRYGFKCQFAHGREEQRSISRHPKFKSELCRTFAINGSCPYGPRCCFIHQTLPNNGGSRTTAPPSPVSTRADSPIEPVSRLAHRMTSSAVAGAPQRNFGPTLSTYIGSNSGASSFGGSALSSLANSPASSFRPSLPATPDSPSFCDPFGDASIGLGLKLNQAPPVHQEPAKSRLHRYSLSSQGSSGSLSSLAQSSPSATSSPVTGFHPHSRTLSNNSSFSSVSSSVASGFSSPYLHRHGSQASLSSSGGVPSSPLALRPIGGHWLSHGPSQTSKPDAFDWPDVEDLLASADDLENPVESRFNPLTFH